MMKRFRKLVKPSWQDAWRVVLSEVGGKRVLHLGCGLDRIPGFVRLDMNKAVAPDVVWDLSVRPYPFEDNSFDFVVAQSVIEHLDDVLSVMGELHRILAPDGRCIVLCPHFSSASAMTDPTHKRFMSARTFDYFIANTSLEALYGFYVPYRFSLRKRMVTLEGWWGWLPFMEGHISKKPEFWENHLCYVMRGAGVYWDIAAVKGDAQVAAAASRDLSAVNLDSLR